MTRRGCEDAHGLPPPPPRPRPPPLRNRSQPLHRRPPPGLPHRPSQAPRTQQQRGPYRPGEKCTPVLLLISWFFFPPLLFSPPPLSYEGRPISVSFDRMRPPFLAPALTLLCCRRDHVQRESTTTITTTTTRCLGGDIVDPYTQLTSVYWKCFSGNQCVVQRFTCDGQEDCADGSDELYCW